MSGADLHMEADFRRQVSLWWPIPGADLIWRQISEADF
jgi:hypothetical protein